MRGDDVIRQYGTKLRQQRNVSQRLCGIVVLQEFTRGLEEYGKTAQGDEAGLGLTQSTAHDIGQYEKQHGRPRRDGFRSHSSRLPS